MSICGGKTGMQEVMNCDNCDWKGEARGNSSRGDSIFCERFNSTMIVQEVENCPGWTFNARHPNESIAEFESRQTTNKLAVSSKKLSILALIISGCTLLVVLIKFILELFIKKTP